MTDYENAVEINGLTKKYDGFTLDNISFSLPKGSIMGFVGQNGSGKTTTIRAMLNIISRDSGSIKLLGLDNLKNEIEVKEQCAAVFDEIPFHDVLTANNLDLILSGIYTQWDRERFHEYLERFRLPAKKKIGKFSKGMKMKLQIAAALSHDAKLLIMDEATTGLDPVVRNEILDIFLEYMADGERTIFMSSHITTDLEKAADSVTFIDNGRLLLTGYKDDILDSHAMLRCTKKDLDEIPESDYISARITDFGADVLTADRSAAEKKYTGILTEKPTLEDILLWYVRSKTAKRWS
ncbi:MAG: ABC transporter ATP-binding protein [Oscillospiraceae bacterium]|nr:ABC transporter ATP-binding protein [Oscillospiraceae bacterium]